MVSYIILPLADTTDVQMVTAIMIEKENTFLVYCDFIPGSNAEGCMVLLVGVVNNVTANIERNSSDLLNYSLSCYHEIFAFDIESDGSVGKLAIPGVLMSVQNNTTPCLYPSTISTTSS